MNKNVLYFCLIIVGLLIANHVLKSQPEEKQFNKIEKKEIITDSDSSDKEQEDDSDIHSEDIQSMFNSDENKKSENINNLVYLDIEYLGNRSRIIINLENNIVPHTCKNFYELCKNKKYVNCKFHRIIKDFMIQGGDIINNDGTGSISIYGEKFQDENFKLKHKRGCISMANSGPNTNGCQFFIVTKDTEWLDGKHVVFGQVVKGMDLIEFMENIETNNDDKPQNDVIIVDCGIL